MKNIILIGALALTVSAHSQNVCNGSCETGKPLYSGDKMAVMDRGIDNTTVSIINPNWDTLGKTPVDANAAEVKSNDCYKMADHKMVAIINGTVVCLNKNVSFKSGLVILTNGILITTAGKVIRLKNGESIDMDGKLINMSPIGKESTSL